MSDLKTKPTGKSVSEFINAIEDPGKRADCKAIMKMMQEATGARPKMWGPSIVGYGSYRYKYESGREGEWFLSGFSPRKQATTLYIMAGFKRYNDLMKKLGKHKTGRSCLYIKRLDDIDTKVLKQLIRESVTYLKSQKP